jgi:hypothetical protein
VAIDDSIEASSMATQASTRVVDEFRRRVAK